MNKATEPLTLLILSDFSDDVFALIRRLKSAGFGLAWQRAQTESEYRAALHTKLDLIFADTNLSQLSLRRSLEILQELELDIPLIILSGSSDEECGLSGLAEQAEDLILKSRLDLVPPAVRRALRNARAKAEQRKLKAQLRQAQQMETVGRVASAAAHDLNNILGVVMLETHFATAAAGLSPDLQQSLNNIRSATEHGASLARELLTLGQPRETQFSLIDLNARVTSRTTIFRRLLGDTAQLQFKLAPHPLFILGDANSIDQILLNLIINGRDALTGHGQITVETFEQTIAESETDMIPGSSRGRYACLSVADTGSGISEADLPRIFEPFFTTKGASQGTGLGLATVSQIVQKHRGFIQVDSKPDQGTTFRIFIPTSDSVAASVAEKNVAVHETRGGTETILVVEDHLEVRRLISLGLARHGYTVLQAGDASSALQIWVQQVKKIDLLLTDIALPDGKSGVDLAAQLRDRQSGFKVIFLSAHGDEALFKRFKFGQGHHFLQKPAGIDQILRAVRRCLDDGAAAAPVDK